MHEKPYIIWTLRRTGGTSFGTLLEKLSSHTSIQHEPFNPDRIYGSISKDWEASYNAERLNKSLSAALDSRPNIKHCFDVVSIPLNAALLKATVEGGYHHILLCRFTEIDRLFSLAIANMTGSWGPSEAKRIFKEVRNGDRILPALRIKESINDMTDCHLRTIWLENALLLSSAPHTKLYFEELFDNPSLGTSKIKTLLAELGHSADRIELLSTEIDRILKSAGQETREMAKFVPNYESWLAALEGTKTLLPPLGLANSLHINSEVK